MAQEFLFLILSGRGDTLLLTTFDPTTFHRETTEMNRLGTPDCRGANCRFSLGNTPKMRNHADAALMNCHHGGVFIRIGEILRQVFCNQFILSLC